MDEAGYAELGKAVLDLLAKVMPYGEIILGRSYNRGWYIDASASWTGLETVIGEGVDASRLLILLGEMAAKVSPLRVPPLVVKPAVTVVPTPTGPGTLDELY